MTSAHDVDRFDFERAIALIKERYPRATAARFSTSDQNNGYGFVLDDLSFPKGQRPTLVEGPDGALVDFSTVGIELLDEELWPIICDIDWSEGEHTSPFREDDEGVACVQLT